MRRHSPYNYAFNNPVFFMDPDGMAPTGGGNVSVNLEARSGTMSLAAAAMTGNLSGNIFSGNDLKNMAAGISNAIGSSANSANNSNGGDPPAANEGNPIQLDTVYLSNKKSSFKGSGGWTSETNQSSYAGTFSQWNSENPQFSSDPILAMEQWQVSYGDALGNYNKAQLDDLISYMHQGQINFLKGSYNLTASVLQDGGDATMLFGYGLTLTGVGAPVGVPLMVMGRGMSATGGTMAFAGSVSRGDVRGMAINGGSVLLGGYASNLIMKSSLTPFSKLILEANYTLKINGAARLLDE